MNKKGFLKYSFFHRIKISTNYLYICASIYIDLHIFYLWKKHFINKKVLNRLHFLKQ
jgi:hypothetical protein